ncbi:MAG: M14 family metallopeptidase [Gemmatimonadaceae bacterium]
MSLACATSRAPDHAISPSAVRATAPRGAALPSTRAERSRYTATSTYADVVAFLDSLQRAIPVVRGTIGRTSQGREIPYLVLSRPQVAGPAEARHLGRPIVYVQANIHAGEVEGKEALLALVRDLAADGGPGVLDSIVLIAVPIYNADGNERVAPQSQNRAEQRGPEVVGERANAQGLDLNRDYIKAEAPETRASLGMFEAWNPDVFVDLHTTDGSFHGYALTYAPPLTPSATGAVGFVRDSLLPILRQRMRARHGTETFDYGNFDRVYEESDPTDTVKAGWFSYDHRPRFGTNYYGLRGRVAVLSEAYSHDPFERRISSTYTFVRELLSLVAERGQELSVVTANADRQTTTRTLGPVPLRARLTTQPREQAVVAEDLDRRSDTTGAEPGVPRGLRRTGRFRTLPMLVYDHFDATLSRTLPVAWAFGSGFDTVARLLQLHGVHVERTGTPEAASVEEFLIDSVIVAAAPFQGHRTVRLEGRWRESQRALPPGTYIVPPQPLGALAAYLLEPESDDGLATWNVFDRVLMPGGAFPVLRITAALGGPRRAAP